MSVSVQTAESRVNGEHGRMSESGHSCSVPADELRDVAGALALCMATRSSLKNNTLDESTSTSVSHRGRLPLTLPRGILPPGELGALPVPIP